MTNFDPKPWEWPNTYDAITRSGNLRAMEQDRFGDGAVFNPRPEFETDDPEPWLDPITRGDQREVRWSSVDNTGLMFYVFEPRQLPQDAAP